MSTNPPGSDGFANAGIRWIVGVAIGLVITVVGSLFGVTMRHEGSIGQIEGTLRTFEKTLNRIENKLDRIEPGK